MRSAAQQLRAVSKGIPSGFKVVEVEFRVQGSGLRVAQSGVEGLWVDSDIRSGLWICGC